MKGMLLKTFLVVWVLCCITAYAAAQRIKQKNVPSIVVNSVQLKFPKATEASWDLIRGMYRARFELDNIDHEVWLDYAGKVKKHIRDFEEKDLPRAVKAVIKRSFNGFEVHNVERIEEGKKVTYRMKLERAPVAHFVVIDGSGKILQNKKR